MLQRYLDFPYQRLYYHRDCCKSLALTPRLVNFLKKKIKYKYLEKILFDIFNIISKECK